MKYILFYVLFCCIRLLKLLFPFPKADGETRILLIQLHYIGDVIFVTPFIESLKQQNKGIVIDIWLNASCAPIIECNPHIDQIYKDPVIQSKYNHPLLFIQRLWLNKTNLKRLWKTRYSYIIDFSGFFDSALVTALAAKGKSVGLVKEPALRWAYNVMVLRDLGDKSLAHMDLELIRYIDGMKPPKEICYRIYTNEQHRQRVKDLIGDKRGPFIAIAPFAGWANKEWPLDRFVTFSKMLSRLGKVTVFILGGIGDTARINDFKELFSDTIINLVGKSGLLESVALMEHADLFVGLDSSMAKIAEAFNIPSVIIYGGTNPLYSAPLGNSRVHIIQNKLDCSAKPGNEYCGDGTMVYKCKNAFECMTQISVFIKGMRKTVKSKARTEQIII